MDDIDVTTIDANCLALDQSALVNALDESSKNTTSKLLHESEDVDDCVVVEATVVVVVLVLVLVLVLVIDVEVGVVVEAVELVLVV